MTLPDAVRPVGTGAARSQPADLPAWWEPLRTRAVAAEASAPAQPRVGDGARDGAVLVLLGEQPGTGPDVLVLERAATLRNHAGQPAFPGGGAEPGDAGPAATALREAYEEVGLDPGSVVIVAALPALWIPVSRYLVTPVLGWWRVPHELGPLAPAEVARAGRLPIAELVDPGNRLRVRNPSGTVGPAFRVRGVLVWGFTAGVLSTVLEMGGWARPWPTDHIEPITATGVSPVP